jgi:hypothetical protein
MASHQTMESWQGSFKRPQDFETSKKTSISVNVSMFYGRWKVNLGLQVTP